MKYLIRNAYGEWSDEAQEFVNYGNGSWYTDENDAYDVASQLEGRSLRIEKETETGTKCILKLN